jgi:hypothetical protein
MFFVLSCFLGVFCFAEFKAYDFVLLKNTANITSLSKEQEPEKFHLKLMSKKGELYKNNELVLSESFSEEKVQKVEKFVFKKTDEDSGSDVYFFSSRLQGEIFFKENPDLINVFYVIKGNPESISDRQNIYFYKDRNLVAFFLLNEIFIYDARYRLFFSDGFSDDEITRFFLISPFLIKKTHGFFSPYKPFLLLFFMPAYLLFCCLYVKIALKLHHDVLDLMENQHVHNVHPAEHLENLNSPGGFSRRGNQVRSFDLDNKGLASFFEKKADSLIKSEILSKVEANKRFRSLPLVSKEFKDICDWETLKQKKYLFLYNQETIFRQSPVFSHLDPLIENSFIEKFETKFVKKYPYIKMNNLSFYGFNLSEIQLKNFSFVFLIIPFDFSHKTLNYEMFIFDREYCIKAIKRKFPLSNVILLFSNYTVRSKDFIKLEKGLIEVYESKTKEEKKKELSNLKLIFQHGFFNRSILEFCDADGKTTLFFQLNEAGERNVRGVSISPEFSFEMTLNNLFENFFAPQF